MQLAVEDLGAGLAVRQDHAHEEDDATREEGATGEGPQTDPRDGHDEEGEGDAKGHADAAERGARESLDEVHNLLEEAAHHGDHAQQVPERIGRPTSGLKVLQKPMRPAGDQDPKGVQVACVSKPTWTTGPKILVLVVYGPRRAAPRGPWCRP